MHHFVILLAGQLVVVVADVMEDLVLLALRQSVGTQHLSEVGLVPMTKWTS